MPIGLCREDLDYMLLTELQKIEPFLKEITAEVIHRYGRDDGIMFIKQCVQDDIIKYYMLKYATVL
jgi:hypothetical protein